MPLPRAELWNVRIKEGEWVGNADLTISSDGSVRGTLIFPRDPNGVETEVTGHVSGNNITLQRKLTGPFQGQIQTWTGVYNYNETSAQGTISGTGGPAHWSASIVVQ
jgi:hypothetical protein